MKKYDLISGKHIVELRDGFRLLVAGDYLPDIDGNGFMCLTSYSDDLRLNDYEVDYDKCHVEFDICKVYEIVVYTALPILANNMDTTCKLVWERKPELSEVERIILENADKKYKYIARDGYIEEEGVSGSAKDTFAGVPDTVVYLERLRDGDEYITKAYFGTNDNKVTKDRFNFPPEVKNPTIPALFKYIDDKAGVKK